MEHKNTAEILRHLKNDPHFFKKFNKNAKAASSRLKIELKTDELEMWRKLMVRIESQAPASKPAGVRGIRLNLFA